MIIRYLYIIFLGVLLSLLVGVGIAAFYQAPIAPKVSSFVSNPMNPNGYNSPEYVRQQQVQQQQYDQYDIDSKMYSRNVSIIALIIAVVFVSLSFMLLSKTMIIADGFLLGGLFTLIYSIIRGFSSDDSKFRFLVVAVSVIIALFLGYIKFIKTSQKPPKKK